MRRALVLVIAVGCGGGKTTPDAASHDSPMIDAPRAAEANCFDGLDDNGDGLADCADPTCAAVATCVAEIPADWTGYAHLYEGSGAAPVCDAPFTQTLAPGQSGLTADAATCGACACGAPANQTCNTPTTVRVQDVTCTNTATFFADLALPADGSCASADVLPGGSTTCGAAGTSPCNVSLTVGPTTVSGGSCAPSGGTATVSPSSFANTGVACTGAPHGGGCTGTDVCQPKPAAPFESGICIQHDGDVDCPATGPFTAKHTFFTGVDDTRGCTACTCGVPAGATCTAQVTAYSTPGMCTATPIATVAAGNCVNLTGNPQVGGRKEVKTTPTGGACGVSGGAVTGTATGTGATTYCCIP